MTLLKEGNDILSIQGLSVGIIDEQNINIPHGAITLVSGTPGSGKTALLIGAICRESNRRTAHNISATASNLDGFLEPAKYKSISGLRPVISLNMLAGNLSRSKLTVAEFLEILPRLQTQFQREGRPSCGREDCALRAVSPEILAVTIREHFDNMVCCIVTDLRPEEDFSFGAVRVLIADRYERIESIDELARLGERRNVAKRLLNSFRVGPDLLEHLREGLVLAKSHDAGAVSVRCYQTNDALASGVNLGLPVGEFVMLDGHHCAVCSRSFSRAEFVAAGIHALLDGVSLSECLAGPLANLGRPEFSSVKFWATELGLQHLVLERTLGSLSPGERLKLGLLLLRLIEPRDFIFIFDDFSSHFCHSDRLKALRVFEELRNVGNTILVGDYDLDGRPKLDYLLTIDSGCVAELKKLPTAHDSHGYSRSDTLTGICKAATRRDLVQIADFPRFPLHALVAVVGAAGSGKSKFLKQIAQSASDCFGVKAELISLESPRKHGDKTLASLVGVMPLIADLYAKLPASRMNGFTAAMFDPDKRGGRCESCKGQGRRLLRTEFADSAWEICAVCLGRRFAPRILDVRYRSLNVSGVLDLSLRDAQKHFAAHKEIVESLQPAIRVGLGELRLEVRESKMHEGALASFQLWKLLKRKRDLRSSILLLDHPFDRLSASDRELMLGLVKELVADGLSVVFTTYQEVLLTQAEYVIDFSGLDSA